MSGGFVPWIQRAVRKPKYGAPTRATGETNVFFVEGGTVYLRKRVISGFGIDPETGRYTITTL